MTLPYLKGWGDTLAETLPSLGNSVAHIINPNMDQQQALKMAIAKDPTLLQQIANNPGLADAMSKMGYGANIGQGLGVAPEVTADRAIKQNQVTTTTADAKVAGATVQPRIDTATASAESAKTGAKRAASDLRVAEGTEGSAIETAESAARTAKVNADEAETKYKMAQDTLKKYPSLQGIDINQVISHMSNGGAVPADLVSRIGMDPGAGDALKLAMQAALNRQDIASRLTIAALKKKDPDYQVAALGGLERQVKEINDRIQSANQTIKNTAPQMTTLLMNQNSADPKISVPAKEQIAGYRAALKDIYGSEDPTDPKSPKTTSLQDMWNEANSKRNVLLGGLMGGDGNKMKGTPGIAGGADIVTQLKADVKNDPNGRVKLNKLRKAGKITEQQFNQILSGK